MRELNEASEKAQEFFGTSNSVSTPGKWVKWYHEGIPDSPKIVRESVQKWVATKGHCRNCTSMSGCFFIEGIKTSPKHPLLPRCHCKNLNESPKSVTAFCNITKFTQYSFTDPKKSAFMEILGFTVDDSYYLKTEFERQAKEKYLTGDYELKLLDAQGQRANIKITVFNKNNEEKYFISGWMIRPDGLITLNTPFGDN